MFTIIDRYVLKSFLYSFVICFAALFGLFIIVEIFDHIKELIELGFYRMVRFIVTTYIFKVFVIFRLLGGPVTLMAAMFTMTRLRKNNELVPLKACGISIYRILMPIFMIAMLIALFGYFNEEVIIPSISGRLLEFDKVMKGKDLDERSNIEVWDGTGKTFFCGKYNVKKRSIEELTINWTEADGTRVQVIADKCVWKPDTDDVDKWFVSNATLNMYGNGDFLPGYPEHYEKDGMVIERPGSSAESGNPGGAPKQDRAHKREDGKFVLASDVLPDDFAHEETYDYMSAAEILEGIDDVPRFARLQALVRYHAHFADPLACIVLLIIGLPFVLRQETANIFLGVGICIIVCAAYIFIGMVARELGSQAVLSPAAAAWFPVLIFGPIGVLIFDALVRT